MPVERDTAVDLIEQDIRAGLGEYFEATNLGFQLAAHFVEQAPMTNGHQTAVVWEYHARHTAPFQGVLPTGRQIVIRGVTVVEQRRGGPVFHRYVDWLDVMAQLGLTSTMRPVVDEIRGRSRARAKRG